MISETEKSLYPAHGGAIEKIARENHIAVEDLIDFSANINPAPPPKRVLERLSRDAADVALLSRYPDINLQELRFAIASHHNIPENNIIIANGSAALIDAALRAVAAKKCLLPVPAFSEYERALSAFGCLKINFSLSAENDFMLDAEKFIDKLNRQKPPFCIINNPHNPTGALIDRERLIEIVQAAYKTRTTVLLDEAFIDYAPQESMISFVSDYNNLVIMRSVTKFYSIPALRVGYAVAPDFLAKKMCVQIPSWSVTTLAVNAAAEIYKDEVFAEKTRSQNETEREWLQKKLRSLGIKVYPSAANFLLLETNLTKLTFAELLQNLITKYGIVVRDCSTYKPLTKNRFVRIAVRSRAENKKLFSALAVYF